LVGNYVKNLTIPITFNVGWALVAESILEMEILPVNDLDVALHESVNKDDKLVFHSCLQHNLEEKLLVLS